MREETCRAWSLGHHQAFRVRPNPEQRGCLFTHAFCRDLMDPVREIEVREHRRRSGCRGARRRPLSLSRIVFVSRALEVACQQMAWRRHG